MQRFDPWPAALRPRRHAGLRLSAALAVLALVACATQAPAPSGATSSATTAPGGSASAAPLANAGGTPGVATPKSGVARVAAPSEVRTRNAVFKLANFDELPGWQQD